MRSSSAPAGHGSCDRSTVATSSPSRSRRPVAPLRYGAEPCVERPDEGGDAPVRPRLTDRAVQELDAFAEPDRVGGPSEHGELRGAHTLQERGDGCVAWCRRTALAAEADRAEPALDVLDEIVPARSPRQRSRLVELVGEDAPPHRRRRLPRRAGSGRGRVCRRGRPPPRSPRPRVDRCPGATRPIRSASGTVQRAVVRRVGRGTPAAASLPRRRCRRCAACRGRIRCPTARRCRPPGRAVARRHHDRPDRGCRCRRRGSPGSRCRPARRRIVRAARRARRRSPPGHTPAGSARRRSSSPGEGAPADPSI